MAILRLHLNGGRIAEVRHCAICQPHEHVIDVACAGCGDGPLVTAQPPDLGDHLSDVALNWLRGHGWQTQPQLLPGPRHLTAPYYQQRHRKESALKPVAVVNL